uniref:Uncharacterized protein n=1 Tax=Anopheles coluzzii TaxID=1518534 RepID=A0A8W7PZ63_ANOCL
MVGREDVGTLRPKLHHHRQLVDALVKLHDRVDELAVVAAARIAKVDVALEIGAHVDRPQQRYLRAEYLHLAGEAGVPVHAAADHVYQLDLLLALRLFARVVDVEVEIAVLQQQARLDRAELVDGGLIVGQIEHPVQIVLHHVQHHLHVGGCGLQGRDQCAHFAARGARAQALDEWLEQHAGRFARFLQLLAGALLVALFPIHGKSAFAAVATFFLLLFLLLLLLLRRLLGSAWSLSVRFTFAIPLMQMAKSLVMKPDSIVSMHTFSSVSANRFSSALSSSLARCSSPRVHAKIDAIGLCRVTVPWAASDSTVRPSGHTSTEVIRPSDPKPCATVSDCTSPS